MIPYKARVPAVQTVFFSEKREMRAANRNPDILTDTDIAQTLTEQTPNRRQKGQDIMGWQIILAIAVPTAAVFIAAIEARGRGKQDIADLRKDHDHLAEKVDEVKAEVKSNGDKIVQLTEGQGEIKGNLDALLVFIKTDFAKGAAIKSADEPAGV